MPHIKRRDGTKQYVGTGRGTPVVFVHEYAVDCLESSVFFEAYRADRRSRRNSSLGSHHH